MPIRCAGFNCRCWRRKRGLWWAVVAFALAVICLAALIVVALALAARAGGQDLSQIG